MDAIEALPGWLDLSKVERDVVRLLVLSHLHWEDGAFPSQVKLAARFHVTRQTMSMYLGEAVKAGVLVSEPRSRGRGTQGGRTTNSYRPGSGISIPYSHGQPDITPDITPDTTPDTTADITADTTPDSGRVYPGKPPLKDPYRIPSEGSPEIHVETMNGNGSGSRAHDAPSPDTSVASPTGTPPEGHANGNGHLTGADAIEAYAATLAAREEHVT